MGEKGRGSLWRGEEDGPDFIIIQKIKWLEKEHPNKMIIDGKSQERLYGGKTVAISVWRTKRKNFQRGRSRSQHHTLWRKENSRKGRGSGCLISFS